MIGNCEICGSEKNVRFYQKRKILCGKHREQMRLFGKIRYRTLASGNDYVDVNTHYEMIVYDRKLKEKGRVLIDRDDREKIGNIGSWCIDGGGYVVNGKYKVKLHQLIMGKKSRKEIDHINRDKLDNRKSNLRFVSHRENTINRVTKGWYQRPNGRWSAYIAPRGKVRHLGTFDTEEEAMKVHYSERKKVYHLAQEKDVQEFFRELFKKKEK